MQCVALCCTVLQCTHELKELEICVLQCVAVCCSVLQYVAVRCSVLQCVAVCCSVLQYVAVHTQTQGARDLCVAVCCSVSQCVAVCCSELQCAAVCCVCSSETEGALKELSFKLKELEICV